MKIMWILFWKKKKDLKKIGLQISFENKTFVEYPYHKNLEQYVFVYNFFL